MPYEVAGKSNAGFQIDLTRALPWVLTYALEPPKESQRERLAREQADKFALDNASRRAELIEAPAVGEVLRGLVNGVVGQLDAMDNRCASEFAGITDPARMRERLREEHRGVRASMATVTRELAAACERAADHVATVGTAAATDAGSVGRSVSSPAEGECGAGAVAQ
jgi:hypothetical protein